MRAAAALSAVCFLAPGCASEPLAPEPQVRVTVATGGGGAGGIYDLLGRSLARIFTERIPGVAAIAKATVGSVFNVQAIEQGRADVGFTQVDVAYFAYSRGTDSSPRPHMRLRAMAVL